MASVKVTFTLDPATIRRLESVASQLKKPKSEVVREAIDEYHQRIGKLSERERRRMLAVLDEMLASPSTRPQHEVDAEIAQIRAVRRLGGRRTPVETGR